MRTITLTIAVPDGAKYMTTDYDGRVTFWRRKPELRESGDWCGRWVYFGDANARIGDIVTEIPVPHDTWRDSLTDLEAQP